VFPPCIRPALNPPSARSVTIHVLHAPKPAAAARRPPPHRPDSRHLSLCSVSHRLQSARLALGTKLSLSTSHASSCGSSSVGQQRHCFAAQRGVHVVLPNDKARNYTVCPAECVEQEHTHVFTYAIVMYTICFGCKDWCMR
jgi:hypothetical protein